MRPSLCAACAGSLITALSASPLHANVTYGDVNVTISSAALSFTSLLLWEFTFGIAPPSGTSSTPAGVTVKTGPNVTWGSPNSTVANTVNGFYSGNSTVSIGNYNQFVAKNGSTLGADYNQVLFSNLVSPSVTPITFTLFDPPGPATRDAALTIRIHGPNNDPDLFVGSFVFGTDGTFTPISLNGVAGVTITNTLVPEPSARRLFVLGFLLMGWVVLQRKHGKRPPDY